MNRRNLYYLQLLIRHRVIFIVLALTIMTGGVIMSCILPPKYEAKSTVFIEKNIVNALVNGLNAPNSNDQTVKVLTYAITSRALLFKVIDNLPMHFPPGPKLNKESLYRRFQNSITVTVKGENLFIVSFKYNNPSIARDFVNTLINLYIKQSTSRKQQDSSVASSILTEQMESIKAKLQKAEDDLSAYKREKGGIITIDEGRLYDQNNLAEQKLCDLELRRRQLEGMRKITRKGNSSIKGKIADLQRRLDDLRITYTDRYPEIVVIKGEIETLKRQLRDNDMDEGQPFDPVEVAKIDAEINAIKISEESLRRYIGSNEAMMRNIPAAKATLQQLELENSNQKKLYDQYFVRQNESEVSMQTENQDRVATFRIVDPAILPTGPISPNRFKILLMGIMGGFGASFALVLVLDNQNSTVKNTKVALTFGLPVLAVIPHIFVEENVEEKRAKNMRLYIIAGIYFFVILCFPLMEIAGLGVLDKIAERIHHIK